MGIQFFPFLKSKRRFRFIAQDHPYTDRGKGEHIMSRADDNAEVVRRGYAAFNAADMKTLTELFDEKSSWHAPGRSPVAGDHRGREAVLPSSAGMGVRRRGPSRPICSRCSGATRAAWWPFITTEASATASASIRAAASSSRSGAAGSYPVGRTSSTSTIGTNSGRSAWRRRVAVVRAYAASRVTYLLEPDQSGR